MLKDILDRIDERLGTIGLSESRAAKIAGLSDSAIRDMRRALKSGKEDAGVSTRTLAKLAPVLETTAEWLMVGVGDNTIVRSVPLMGYLGAGAEVEPDYEQVPPEGLDQIEIPFPLPDDMIAFKVRGVSMLPVFKPDTVIIVYREQKKPIESFYGEEAAVRTVEGRRFVKTITRGTRAGTVTLNSWNDPVPLEEQELAWIGEIFAVLPPSALNKVRRQNELSSDLTLRTA